MKQKLVKTLALWALNYGLKWLMTNEKVQEKQKKLVLLLNTILDATRDMKLTDEELNSIKSRMDVLLGK